MEGSALVAFNCHFHCQEMSTNLPRSTPWIDWDEWTTVKNYIYCDDFKNNILALECIALWKVRGKLPHSVESTAQLLEVFTQGQCV